MAKKTTELFTPYEQRAALADPRPPLMVNIIYIHGRYYLDALGRYWPLPARWDRLWQWLRGRRVWALALLLAALAAVGACAWWVLVK